MFPWRLPEENQDKNYDSIFGMLLRPLPEGHNNRKICSMYLFLFLVYPQLQLFSICLIFSVKDSCQKPACYEKTVTLTKEPYDSLGMTVAGGMSSRGWDLPIYVTNVDSDGVVGQEGSIRKGKVDYE